MDTKANFQVRDDLVENYFETLVNRFFKILPMWENQETSLPVYMRSLQAELAGLQELIPTVGSDPQFLSLLCVLEYFIDNPQSKVKRVRGEVFRAISLCNKLKASVG